MTLQEAEIILEPKYEGPRLHIYMEPEGKFYSLPLVKTVRQLLSKLDLPLETALVARDKQLLTYDQHLYADECILVRKVGSRG